MARAVGARSELAFVFESTYGTAPASGYTQMPFASAGLGSEQPLNANELLGYGRDPLAPTKDVTTVDGDVVVPIDAQGFGHWLKAAFGAPTTSGSDPYTHEFKTGGWTLPSFAAELAMPEVPRFAMYTGCVMDSLSWQMGRSGLLTATGNIVAQKESVDTTTNAGTPSPITLTRFGHFQGSVKRDTVALGNLVSAEVNYANNLDKIETIRADGAIDGADPGVAAMTGNIVTRFADSTLVTQATNGTSCELEFAYVSGDHSLTVTVHEVYLPVPRLSVPGPGGIQATFDWQAALNSTEGCMATITLVNDVASY